MNSKEQIQRQMIYMIFVFEQEIQLEKLSNQPNFSRKAILLLLHSRNIWVIQDSQIKNLFCVRFISCSLAKEQNSEQNNSSSKYEKKIQKPTKSKSTKRSQTV